MSKPVDHSRRGNVAMAIGICLVGCLLATPISVNAQERYFPELIFFPKNKVLDGFVSDHLTLQLKAVKEPSLWELSRANRSVISYRFFWLATGEAPICMRLNQSGQDFTMHVASHNGPPGQTVGRITLNKDVQISRNQREHILGLLRKTTFWTAPVEVKETRGIADDDVILIEGVAGGKYHVVDRTGSTTGEGYKAFCRALLELAKPDLVKTWDRRRESERKSPDYCPEPPETEDQGETVPAPEEL